MKYALPLALVFAGFLVPQANAADTSVNINLNSFYLAYYWNNAVVSQDCIPASCDTLTTPGGWVPGLDNPSVTVSYHAAITNLDTGTPVNAGASVPVGTNLRLTFTPHAYADISWFGMGHSSDSPYGDWIADAAAPARACLAKDFVRHFETTSYWEERECLEYDYWPDCTGDVIAYHNGVEKFDIYIPLVVDPPSKNVSGTGGLSCGALSGNTMDCTVTSPGSYAPTFDFSATSGKFYYRYIKTLGGDDGTGYSESTVGCTANNIPMRQSTSPGVDGGLANPNFSYTTGAIQAYQNTVASSHYLLSVPSASITIPFTAVQTNAAPTISISGPTSGQTNTSYTFTFSGSDSNGDQMRYGVDWDNNGSVDEWLPASGYVNSGTSQQKVRLWGTAAAYTFQALAQDSQGANSSFVSHTITIAEQPQVPTALLTASPTSIVQGQTSLLQWSSTNATSCSIDQGIGGVAVNGSTSVSPASTVTYTLTCTGPGGTASDTETLSVVAPPDLTPTIGPPVTATAGAALDYTGTTYNNGGSAAGQFRDLMIFYLSDQSTWHGYAYTSYSTSLAAGSSVGRTVSYTFPSAGTYYYRLCNDWEGAVPESSEANNCSAFVQITVTAFEADLTAGSITPTSATAGTAVTLNALATNTGNGTSGSFPMLFQVSETGALFNSSYGAGLAPGGSQNMAASYTFPSAGTYNVRACANKNTSWVDIVTESNYANNCGPWTVVSVAAPAPTGSLSCSVDNSNPPPDTTVTYTVTPSGGASGPYVWNDSQGGSYGSGSTASRLISGAGPYVMNVSGDNVVTQPVSCPVISGACTSASATISATPDRVREGETTTLSWSASGVDGTCSITGTDGYSTTITSAACTVPTGSVTRTITTQTVYTITCDGGETTDEVVVNVIPKFNEF